MYEKTLKPFLRALNEGDESVVSGPLSLPHMVPLLKLMEGEDGVENSERGCQLLYNILQSSRHTANHANDFQQHAHTLLSAGWEPIPELLEVFHTEFALRLFWGHAGAEAGRKERYEKFDKILTILSNKLEPAQTGELWPFQPKWQEAGSQAKANLLLLDESCGKLFSGFFFLYLDIISGSISSLFLIGWSQGKAYLHSDGILFELVELVKVFFTR